MNYYENLLVLDSSLDEKALNDAVDRVKNVILKKGGEILKAENWGLNKLAYVLKKHKKGVYMLLVFKAPPATIADLEKFFKVLDPLIKFLIIKLTRKQIEAVENSIVEAENKKVEAEAESNKTETAPAVEEG
ncbi:MAG TPA: 30S ribosomal protein S6 [Nitrospirae bacterium]|nr:30S ribosomal protein S6 [Nitrospirota bacterium]